MEYNKALYSNESEQSVLGSMLLDNSVIDKVSFLHDSDFHSSEHKSIYRAILSTYEKYGKADLILTNEIYDKYQGALSYLADLAKNTPSSANAIAYAYRVLDYSIKREILSAQEDLRESMSNSEIDYLAATEEFNLRVNSAIARKSSGEVVSIDDLVEISLDEMEKSSMNVKTGLSTGITEVDERLGDMYLPFGEITVIGGLSKNGKTLLANTITARVELDEGEVGHIFSIEMTSAAMFNSIISARTGIPANFYRKLDYYAKNYSHRFDEFMGKWGKASTELKESKKFSFDGKKEVDADYICAGMRKQAALAKSNGKVLRYVLIDHLHRMNFHNGNGPMTYAIRDAVRKIKNTASDLGVSVLMLAQLNNKAEKEIPTSFHILDSSSVRHELQAFIGIKMYKQDGGTFFGIYADSQRYADTETRTDPAYMVLTGGVLRSLPEGTYFAPDVES